MFFKKKIAELNKTNKEIKKIVVIDDDVSMHDVFKVYFGEKYETTCYETLNPNDFKKNLSLPDLFVIDINLQERNGFDIGQVIREIISKDIPIIYISLDKDYKNSHDKIGDENTFFMNKPLRRADLGLALHFMMK